MMNISHVLFFSVTVLLIERAGGRKGLYMEYNEETEERGLRRLSSNALKLTACVCMAVDHIGIVFMDNARCGASGVSCICIPACTGASAYIRREEVSSETWNICGGVRDTI